MHQVQLLKLTVSIIPWVSKIAKSLHYNSQEATPGKIGSWGTLSQPSIGKDWTPHPQGVCVKVPSLHTILLI